MGLQKITPIQNSISYTKTNIFYNLFLFSGIPKNGSVPTFDRVRKHSTGERFKPSLAAIRASSRGDVGSNGDVRKHLHLKLSRGSVHSSKNNNAEDFVSISQNFSKNKKTSIIGLLQIEGVAGIFGHFFAS